MISLKETLLLPKTEFPMRANLPQNEPEAIRRWGDIGIESLISQKNAHGQMFVLHDGPPYANGNIHMGTLLNKVLKDIVIRHKNGKGFSVRYVPGWDTHGLPIEMAVQKKYGKGIKNDTLKLRSLCRAYADDHIRSMTDEFIRLGISGDWSRPYKTMDPAFEANEVLAFSTMYENGLVHKDFKPVNWCPNCETALAEAEIEYRDIASQSLYVLFPVIAGNDFIESGDLLMAWTTTPWTLPGNRALAVNKNAIYVRCESNDRYVVISKATYGDVSKKIDVGRIVSEFKGSDLVDVIGDHPFGIAGVPVVGAEYVSDSDGTGIVHTAPGHGVEDFLTGKANSLEVVVVVDEKGIFDDIVPSLSGLRYDEATKKIVEVLTASGKIALSHQHTHSYPHCWRCHGKILLRATEQWFVNVGELHDRIATAIANTNWYPRWGGPRMEKMIGERNEWCISRQRAWGMPIPAVYCNDCGGVIVSEIAKTVSGLFRENGSDIWFKTDVENIIPSGFCCPRCGSISFRKETDTLDVWFDSGCSHLSVVDGGVADLYLEGTDQFRGWFNSSLVTSVAVSGVAPYRAVLAHGFVVDKNGDKMSKSVGNTVAPSDLLKKYGADILRLWVASANHKSDISISDSILDQTAESYRKIRNTIRYLLANLSDNPTQMPDYDSLPKLERLILNRLDRLVHDVDLGYDEYSFHVVYQKILDFISTDLSSFYIDVRKDALYNLPSDSHERICVVATIERIARCLMVMLSPILPFTMEEAFSYLPKKEGDPESVHLLSFPKQNTYCSDDIENWYAPIQRVRDIALLRLEQARGSKEIGSSIDASLTIVADDKMFDFLTENIDVLPTVFIVSNVTINKRPVYGDIDVVVDKASGVKCQRCAKVSLDHVDTKYGNVCARCLPIVQSFE